MLEVRIWQDLAGFGKNDQKVDIVEILNGEVSSTAQMKFVSDPEALIRKIAEGEGGGKNDYSRYMSVDRLEVPTEQVNSLKLFANEKAAKLTEQAQEMRDQGNYDLADKLDKQANNYYELEQKIADSGLTIEEAIDYRLNPEWETAKDIADVSHQAGIEGAELGGLIGGIVSAVSNAFEVSSGKKELGEAVKDSAKQTLVSAAIGYGSGFVGTEASAYMQQSGIESLEALSDTAAPYLIVPAAVKLFNPIKSYFKGEISGRQLAEEVGVTAAGMTAATVAAGVGQVLIPIPFVGAAIGGMIGYAVTNNLARRFFDWLKGGKFSDEKEKEELRMKYEISAALSREYGMRFRRLFDNKAAQLDKESNALFDLFDDQNASAGEICAGINRFAEVFGKKLSINSMKEFDELMLSKDKLVI